MKIIEIALHVFLLAFLIRIMWAMWKGGEKPW